jgi:hypothetical protein
VELVRRAVHVPIPFRAVVADNFYGEDRGFRRGLRDLQVGYVLALKPSHAWWHPEAEIGSFQEAALAAGWECAERPGHWIKVTRTIRSGSAQDRWALELDIRPYGPDKQERVIVARTDPATLPDLTTFYLITNLPVPQSRRAQDSTLAAASVEEVVRLYGLRMWVEQSYKQVKHALSAGRSTRSGMTWPCGDIGNSSAVPSRISWYHQAHAPTPEPLTAPVQPALAGKPEQEKTEGRQRAQEKKGARSVRTTAGVLAQSLTSLKPPGSNPGSCSSGFGWRGRHSPRPSRFNSSLPHLWRGSPLYLYATY